MWWKFWPYLHPFLFLWPLLQASTEPTLNTFQSFLSDTAISLCGGWWWLLRWPCSTFSEKTSGFNFKTKTEKALTNAIDVAKEEELDAVIKSEYTDLTNALQTYKANAIDSNKKQLKTLLTDEIIKRYFYSEGLYTYYTANNNEIKKALSILNNPKQYASILR